MGENPKSRPPSYSEPGHRRHVPRCVFLRGTQGRPEVLLGAAQGRNCKGWGHWARSLLDAKDRCPHWAWPTQGSASSPTSTVLLCMCEAEPGQWRDPPSPRDARRAGKRTRFLPLASVLRCALCHGPCPSLSIAGKISSITPAWSTSMGFPPWLHTLRRQSPHCHLEQTALPERGEVGTDLFPLSLYLVTPVQGSHTQDAQGAGDRVRKKERVPEAAVIP